MIPCDAVKVLRLFLLFVCAAGVLGGLGLVVVFLKDRRRQEDPWPTPAPMAIPAGSVTIADAGVAVAAFEVDALEVSVLEYAACVRAGACPLYTSAADSNGDIAGRLEMSAQCVGGQVELPSQPMNCVDWHAASAYCRWAGGRLPTQEEWWLAVGSKHPAQLDELHRDARPAVSDSYFAAEWTSTPARVGKRGPWDNLRCIGVWRTHRDERYGQARDEWRAVNVRLPEVRFRCAR